MTTLTSTLSLKPRYLDYNVGWWRATFSLQHQYPSTSILDDNIGLRLKTFPTRPQNHLMRSNGIIKAWPQSSCGCFEVRLRMSPTSTYIILRIVVRRPASMMMWQYLDTGCQYRLTMETFVRQPQNNLKTSLSHLIHQSIGSFEVGVGMCPTSTFVVTQYSGVEVEVGVALLFNPKP